MSTSGRLNCGRLWSIGVWRYGLEGVDWKSIEEFVGNDERSFVRAYKSSMEDL